MQSLTEGFREQFSDNISRLLQQEGSILRTLVRNEQMQHEVEYFDSILPSEAFTRAKDANDGYDISNKIGTNGDYAFRSPDLIRRQITAQQIFWHTSFDSGDKLNVLLEPKSFQIKDAAWALGRQYDRIILNAFPAIAKTGRSGQNSKYFPLKTQIIPVGVGLQDGTNALLPPEVDDPIYGCIKKDNVSLGEKERAGGLTLAKLLKAREILRKNMFGSRDKMYFICSISQISNLLKDSQITSADYNNVRALVSGDITSFAGFEFITTELIGGIKPNIQAAGNFTVRDCFAFTESSILFGKVKGGFSANADRLPQHMDAILVKAMDSVGAMRMNDKGVVCVKCLERYDESHAGFKSASIENDAGKAAFVSTVPSFLFLKDASNLGLDSPDDINIIAQNVAEKYEHGK